MKIVFVYMFALLVGPRTAIAGNLMINGSCPGAVENRVGGMAANAPIRIFESAAAGSAVIPAGACAGTVTGLSTINPIANGLSNPAGRFRATTPTPPYRCGNLRQAIDLTTCTLTPVRSTPLLVDADGDGAPVPFDCNDADGSIFPGALDVAGDGIDQDCDGVDAACPTYSTTVIAEDSVCLDYAGGGIWADDMVRAYNSPPSTDITGWMLFDLASQIPAGADILTMDAVLYQDGSAWYSPELEIWYSSYDSWDRASVGSYEITKDALISDLYTTFSSDSWQTYALDLTSFDVASELADGWLTIGTDNPNASYSYVYFKGPDSLGQQPYIDVTYQVCGLALVDADGDGYDSSIDCDDSDPSLNLDDVDMDGASTCDGDCDDYDVNLNLVDTDGDGTNTCDGDCDDNDYYLNLLDSDSDGVSSCDGDCDDYDASENTYDADFDGASTCDGDCDDADFSLNVLDLDIDGFSTCDGDCDDYDAAIHPDMLEIDSDGIDQDCDGSDAYCPQYFVNISATDSVCLDYDGGGIWRDDMVRAYNSPPGTDIVGWMSFDLATHIPATHSVVSVKVVLYQDGSANYDPQLELWYSSFDTWERDTVGSYEITRDALISDTYESFSADTWHEYRLDMDAFNANDDLLDGWLTVGIDNPNLTYSYVYFKGPDTVGLEPYIQVRVEECL